MWLAVQGGGGSEERLPNTGSKQTPAVEEAPDPCLSDRLGAKVMAAKCNIFTFLHIKVHTESGIRNYRRQSVRHQAPAVFRKQFGIPCPGSKVMHEKPGIRGPILRGPRTPSAHVAVSFQGASRNQIVPLQYRGPFLFTFRGRGAVDGQRFIVTSGDRWTAQSLTRSFFSPGFL